jgi:WD40 repeat protein
MVNHIIKSFRFANNNRDIVVVTKDCKVRFYSLLKYEGIFLREVTNCHRGAITDMSISANSGYMLTGGEDNMLKIWDYEAQKTVPYYFQAFIGHTYPVNALMFNPRNNHQIISVGQFDGIFIWDFNGDTESDYKQAHIAGQDLPIGSAADDRAPSLLEKIRTANKAKKAFRNQMSEDSFIIPQFKSFDQSNVEFAHRDFIEAPTYVQQKRADRKLVYTHYTDCSKKVDIQNETSNFMSFGGVDKNKILEQKLVNGYDGYGGVHNNLIWNVAGGFTYYTLNNKFIIENTKTREQTVFTDSSVQLSCMVSTIDFKMVAVAEGCANAQGSALIYLYDCEKRKLINTLRFHTKGVQTMDFTIDGKYLISVGVQGEDDLAVFNIAQNLVVRHHLHK